MADPFPAGLVTRQSFWLAALAILLSSCGGDTQPSNSIGFDFTDEDIVAVREDVLRVARKHERQSITAAESLVISTDRFLASPGEESQAVFRDTWLKAHQAFSSLVPLIYIAGQEERIFEIDAWPIEPGFLDSLPSWPDSGIINDFTLEITSTVLVQQHGITDPGEVSLGFHPIEYFAFVRPIEDFVIVQEPGTAADRVLRRRTALQLIAAHLVESVLILEEQLPENIWLRLTPQTESVDGLAVMRTIIGGSHSTALHAFNQAGLFIETDGGHCAYSGASAASLLAELETLREIYRPQGNLMFLLNQIDPVTSQNLDKALDQALEVLRNTETPVEVRARLPLMLSAVSHQLEEFDRFLGRSSAAY